MTWKQLSPSRLHHLALGPAYGMTHVGMLRTTNEDNFLIDEALCLVMVGDGMGGHEAGEVASAGALTGVQQFLIEAARANVPAKQSSEDPDATWTDETLPAVATMFDAIDFANRLLYAENVVRHMSEGEGMGTTLTGLWCPAVDSPLIVFQVGDSRLYRYRDGEFALLTRDQTLYQQALDAGMVDDLPKRNMLLQAIGPSPVIKPDVRTYDVAKGDLFMLCSDGLHGAVAHADMESVMRDAAAIGFEQACQRLIALANADGGRDNITAVMVAVEVV